MFKLHEIARLFKKATIKWLTEPVKGYDLVFLYVFSILMPVLYIEIRFF